MGFSRSPFAFEDIHAAFERALAAPKGIRVVCQSRSDAVLTRSRFNYFRQLNRRANAQTYERDHPMHGTSVYDKLQLRIPPRGSPDEATIYIEPRTMGERIIEEIP